jgi:APA family basic amino acid/polyamine antiporter
MGALTCLYLMTGLPAVTWLRLLIWLALGLAIYFIYGRRAADNMRTARGSGALIE